MDFSIARRIMVDRQVKAKGIDDSLVLEAMLQTPRHLFVEEAFQSQAYSDFPLPIGEKQTISQPYIVGLMTEALLLKGGERVLEIGTGSGYQSAILSRIASRVYTVERIPDLARRARRVLNSLGCHNVNIKVSDGTTGWADEAPFDAIIVTAGAPSVPEGYIVQLKPGGRLIIPVGNREGQVLKRFTCSPGGGCMEETLVDCRFVPLLGRHGWAERTGQGQV
jgi:protein-L-isoaspartate(D-aspartate) O-methyltransferase